MLVVEYMSHSCQTNINSHSQVSHSDFHLMNVHTNSLCSYTNLDCPSRMHYYNVHMLMLSISNQTQFVLRRFSTYLEVHNVFHSQFCAPSCILAAFLIKFSLPHPSHIPKMDFTELYSEFGCMILCALIHELLGML